MELEREARSCGDTAALADLGYALRESIKLLEDASKELKRVEKLTAQMFCTLWAMDPLAADRVKTEWCSCAGVVKTVCNPPDPEAQPEEFAAVMRAIGVPDEAIKTGAMKLSFQGLGDWMTHAERQGLNLPEACKGTVFKDYRLNIIARRKLSSVLSEASIRDGSQSIEEPTL